MKIKFMAVAAVAAFVCAGFGGTKSVGYIGASTGTKPGSLKVVEVDNDTGAIGVVDTLPLANTTYIAVNKARTRLYTSCADAAFGGKGANGGVAVYSIDPSGSYRYADGVFTPVRQLSLIPEGFTDFSKAAAIKLSADGSPETVVPQLLG